MAKYWFEKWSLDWDFPINYFTGSAMVRNSKGLQIINFDGSVRISESADDFNVGDIFASNVMDFEKYKISGGSSYIYKYIGIFNTINQLQYKQHQLTWLEIQSFIKKVNLENIIADEDEYPENGIQGDYWYIRGEKAFPELKINGQSIGGAKIKDSVGQMRNVGNVYFKDSSGTVRNLK